MRALVTGATGFVGRRLLARLDRPVIFSRNARRAAEQLVEYHVTAHGWDPLSGPPPAEALAGVDTIFHLAGEPVGEERWNDALRKRIADSRVVGTRNLVEGLASLDQRPKVLVCASAVGYYGAHGGEGIDESTPPGDDFLAQVCVDWEREAARAEDFGVRVVSVRIGVVLGKGGGALAKMLTPFRLGLGGRLGHGRQWMPWVHVDDVVGVMLHAAADEQIRGPINATAPVAATNLQFTKALGKALHRPTIFPMPAPILRLLVGPFAEIILCSQQITPRVAQESGYEFQYSDVDSALAEIVGA